MKKQSEALESLRIDKWLWATRFYKTRMLATAAINGGKVQVNGVRVKAGKKIVVNSEIKIKKGTVYFDIVVLKIVSQRRPAKEVILAYQETEQSLLAREQKKKDGQENQENETHKGRPSKKARRQLEKISSKFDLT